MFLIQNWNKNESVSTKIQFFNRIAYNRANLKKLSWRPQKLVLNWNAYSRDRKNPFFLARDIAFNSKSNFPPLPRLWFSEKLENWK